MADESTDNIYSSEIEILWKRLCKPNHRGTDIRSMNIFKQKYCKYACDGQLRHCCSTTLDLPCATGGGTDPTSIRIIATLFMGSRQVCYLLMPWTCYRDESIAVPIRSPLRIISGALDIQGYAAVLIECDQKVLCRLGFIISYTEAHHHQFICDMRPCAWGRTHGSLHFTSFHFTSREPNSAILT